MTDIPHAHYDVIGRVARITCNHTQTGRRHRPAITATPDPCKDDGVRIARQIVVLDAADLSAESTFWAGLLGGSVDAEDDWHSVYVDGEPRLGIQLAPNHVSPDWPGGAPQQIHLDLFVDDVTAAHDEAIALGARLLKPADDMGSAQGYQVYADPAGHPFCLCWG